jgi:phospholipase C
VTVVQENRTFNNFFATFPGADGTTMGKAAKDPNCHVYKSETVLLRKTPLAGPNDLNHYYEAFRIARDGGKMEASTRFYSAAWCLRCRYAATLGNAQNPCPRRRRRD